MVIMLLLAKHLDGMQVPMFLSTDGIVRVMYVDLNTVSALQDLATKLVKLGVFSYPVPVQCVKKHSLIAVGVKQSLVMKKAFFIKASV